MKMIRYMFEIQHTDKCQIQLSKNSNVNQNNEARYNSLDYKYKTGNEFYMRQTSYIAKLKSISETARY